MMTVVSIFIMGGHLSRLLLHCFLSPKLLTAGSQPTNQCSLLRAQRFKNPTAVLVWPSISQWITSLVSITALMVVCFHKMRYSKVGRQDWDWESSLSSSTILPNSFSDVKHFFVKKQCCENSCSEILIVVRWHLQCSLHKDKFVHCNTFSAVCSSVKKCAPVSSLH